jgi:hypothetical protein
VQIVTYDGQAVTDEIWERCEVIACEEGGFAQPLVKETVIPEICRNGILLQKAKLICWKAAAQVERRAEPEDAAPATEALTHAAAAAEAATAPPTEDIPAAKPGPGELSVVRAGTAAAVRKQVHRATLRMYAAFGGIGCRLQRGRQMLHRMYDRIWVRKKDD